MPLSAVVAYELLRTRPGGAPSILRQTKTTEFLDTTAVPGVTYSYQVRLVVSGFSAESIERATGLFNAAQQLLTEGIRSVLSRKPWGMFCCERGRHAPCRLCVDTRETRPRENGEGVPYSCELPR